MREFVLRCLKRLTKNDVISVVAIISQHTKQD